MKIGDFARQFNVSTHAVRYYINMGLLVYEAGISNSFLMRTI